MKVKLGIILILLIFAVSGVKATTFHGDIQRTGNFSDIGPKSSELVYTISLNPIHGSPIVWNGEVFVIADYSWGGDNSKVGLYKIDKNGTVIWHYGNVYGMSTPSVDDNGYIYAHIYNGRNGNGELMSFYTNGTLRWNVTTDPSTPSWYISSSPLVYNGSIYVLSYYGKLYKFDTRSSEIWNFTAGSTLNAAYMSTPSAWSGKIYFIANVSGTYKLFAIDENKNQVWNESLLGIPKATPVIYNGVVYIPTSERLYGFNATNGDEIWNVSFNGVLSTPAVYDDKIYIANKTKLFCFNTQTMHELWNFTAIPNANSFDSIASSPAIADGIVYFATNTANGTIYALNATTGSVVWKYVTNNYIMSSPFIYNGKLYIGADDNNLYIFGLWKGKVNLNPAKITVELKDGSATQINGNTALAALIKASESGGFNVTVVNSTWGLYVESVANVQPQGWNGWMYVVNGVMPSVGAAKYTLNNSDTVEFFYGSWGISPVDAEYRLIIQVNLTNIIWNGTVELKQGNFTIMANGNSYEVSNLTALGALNAANLVARFNYTVNDKWYESWGSLLVDSIYGIENNGTSGWMYWVNYPNESMPMTGANAYSVKDGDTIYWYYSTSMNDTPNNSSYVIKINVKTEKVFVNSFNVSKGSRGGYATAWVNLTAIDKDWYVIVVSGTNNGEGIAGISTVQLNANEPLSVPVLVSIPQQVLTGDYKLYVGVYNLNEYPSNILKWYGYRICEVS